MAGAGSGFVEGWSEAESVTGPEGFESGSAAASEGCTGAGAAGDATSEAVSPSTFAAFSVSVGVEVVGLDVPLESEAKAPSAGLEGGPGAGVDASNGSRSAVGSSSVSASGSATASSSGRYGTQQLYFTHKQMTIARALTAKNPSNPKAIPSIGIVTSC